MQIIDGKKVSSQILQRLAEEGKRCRESSGKTPGLAVVLVGEDPASQVYVRNKNKQCIEIGFSSFEHRLAAETSQEELMRLIAVLNADPAVHGILVQLPLPQQIDSDTVLGSIDPKKDVDGFHPINIGGMWMGQEVLLPCTPAGVIEMLENYKIPIAGQNAVVIGRSNIVGKPLSALLLKRHATVTICHSRTKDLSRVCASADLLFAAIGKPRFITKDMVRPGAVVIDIGINRVDGKLCGDVDFQAVSGKVSYITPVPGGVGPMTIAMLMANTLKAFRRAENME